MITGKNEISTIEFFKEYDKVVCGYTTKDRGDWQYYPKRNSDIENYRLLARKYHIKCENIIRPDERHTANVCVAKSKYGGEGVLCNPKRRWIDGLITNEPNLMLSITTADCAGLYIFDPVHAAIGISHCGRRGIKKGIVKHTIEAFKKKYHTSPQDLKAVIGPHICKDCYQVDMKTAKKFAAVFPKEERKQIVIEDDFNICLNLDYAITLQLLSLGLKQDHIINSKLCNLHSHHLFYSYRGGDAYKANLAYIMLKGNV